MKLLIRGFGKLFYGINIIAAILLIISFIIPYMRPSAFPTLAVLSLFVSPLIFLNLFFLGYWIFRLKRKALFSLFAILVAYFYFSGFFQLSVQDNDFKENPSKALKILSYNVRLFNAYEKNNNDDEVAKAIHQLLEKQKPDVLCLQEYYAKHKVNFNDYPYKYIHYKSESHKLGHVIFSKYPIVNKGAFDFENTYNNSLFADIAVGRDTIRVYNIHLQSLGILPTVDFLQQKGTETIKKRIAQKFVQQEAQMRPILAHQKAAPYPIISVGDFNNTAFSFVYRKLKEGMQDTFQEKGNGLGTTFYFNNYPLRIDFIFASLVFKVKNHQVISSTFSDHYPVISTLNWE